MSKKIKVGVAGCGYWGPNLIRNFRSLADVNLKMLEATGIQIAHHLEVHVRQRTEVTNEVRPPVTATRDADFDFL